MSLGEKIQKLRKENGMSQEHLAELAEVSRQAVSKWELDESVPDIENLLRLSNLFDVSTDYLLKDNEKDDAMKPAPQAATPPDTWAVISLISMVAGFVLALVGWRTWQTLIPMGIGFIIQLCGCIILAATQTAQLRLDRKEYYYLAALLLPPIPSLIAAFAFLSFYPHPYSALNSILTPCILSIALSLIAILIIRKKLQKADPR